MDKISKPEDDMIEAMKYLVDSCLHKYVELLSMNEFLKKSEAISKMIRGEE